MTDLHVKGDIIADRYEITGFVGQGGMQYVYAVNDSILNRTVALKTPKIDSAEKRFHRSAIVSALVNHPNVAKTLDYFELDNGRAYLIEELIIGSDLDKSILSNMHYIDPFLATKILHYLSKGLAASHHAGVVHRDLKPTNIMVSGGFQIDQIKITDFGIAKMADEEIAEAAEGGSDTITTSQTMVGALPYMAPEAIQTPRDVGTEADVWSLGAMMYELVTGTKPFGSGLKAVNNILVGDFPKYPKFMTSNPQFRDLSNNLIDIIDKCLSKSRSDRPSADELVASCGDLCYPVSQRRIGHIKLYKHNRAWGFISVEDYDDVFFHRQSIYGATPDIGEPVMFSEFIGGGANRAYPVVALAL